MPSQTYSSPFHHSQQFWMQLVMGPSASALKQEQRSSRETTSTTSWLYPLVMGLLIGGQCWTGVWDKFFLELERFVVPFYTLLILLYLFILVAGGPLETLYHLFFSSSKTSTKTTTRPTALQQDDLDALAAPQPFDLSGAYKLMKNDNFDGFLAVQGVPWALRRAANAARPVHRITHKGNQLTIKIEGIIESQTTYIINGPPVETNVRGRIFQDQVQYVDGGAMGICVSKTALTEAYDVTVQRVLSEDQQEITMTSRAIFRDDREPIQCLQKFRRVE